MKIKLFILTFIIALVSCNDDDDNPFVKNPTDYFAVANRGSGTVTLYNGDTVEKVTDITLAANAEPTYVAYSKKRDMLYVSDFSNQSVTGYAMNDFSQQVTYSTQTGSFHMWLNDTVDQLWVNNIVDKTTTVIDLNTGEVLANLGLPETLNLNADTAQHDVIISPSGDYAYVSLFSQTGTNYVLQYNTNNRTLENSVAVGGDPHLAVTNSFLYILSQDDSSISEYSFNTFAETGSQGMVSNAHGVTPGAAGTIYITNISERRVAAYNTTTTEVDALVDAQATEGVAHNLAYNPFNGILALTISGGSTTEFFNTSSTSITPISTDNSGSNPFGIVFMERE